MVYKQFREKDVEVLPPIANKASGDLKKLRDDISLALENDNVLTAAIPANHRLDCPHDG